MTSLLAVFEAETGIKSARLIKSRLNTRKKENVEIKTFYIKLHLKDCFGIELKLLRRADARGSADIIYCISITHIARLRVRHSY